jgi:hypothetical protein
MVALMLPFGLETVAGLAIAGNTPARKAPIRQRLRQLKTDTFDEFGRTATSFTIEPTD